MRILQLIDSLEIGGAERMAVNYANALTSRIEASFLCVTRKEGPLVEVISNQVNYFFLKRNSTVDLIAIIRLRQYIKKNEIQLIHAHGSSFFIAVLIKMLCPKIKLIWHDHYGLSEKILQRKSKILKLASSYFDVIFSVNKLLKKWAEEVLAHQAVYFVNNFVIPVSEIDNNTELKGMQGQRVVCVANLRPQKNHQLLLRSFELVLNEFPEATLHLYGKNFHDAYAAEILKKISCAPFKNKVFYNGAHTGITQILPRFDLGVLASDSEGLPLTLLEYGMASLPAIATDVGACKAVLAKCGTVVPKDDHNSLAQAIKKSLNGTKKNGRCLKHHIESNYSEKAILDQVIAIYAQII